MINIKDILPHREPFIFVDGVVSMNETSIHAYKNVHVDEPYFKGHFPGNPIMPGVLIQEACAQAGAIVLLSKEGFQGKIAYFAGADKIRFKRMVKPGERLELYVELERMKDTFGIAKAKAMVGSEVCFEGTLKFSIGD